MAQRKVGRPRAVAAAADTAVDTRHDIMRAARQLFRQKGFAATSTREIAEAAGLRQPTLFHYFANKNEILLAIALQAMAPITAAPPATPSVADDLYQLVYRNALHLATDDNALGSPLQFPELRGETFAAFWPVYERAIDGYRQLLKRGMREGVFVQQDISVAVAAVVALVETVLPLNPLRSAKADRVAQQVATMVLGAVTARR